MRFHLYAEDPTSLSISLSYYQLKYITGVDFHFYLCSNWKIS